MLVTSLLLLACQPQTEPPTDDTDSGSTNNPGNGEDIGQGKDDTASTSPTDNLMINDSFNKSHSVSTRPRITEDYGLKTSRNFSVSCPTLKLNYSCLKEKRRELIVLDGGHDDTSSSSRSEDHTLSSSDPNYGKPRKNINEGRLNFIVSWIAREILTQCTPGLSLQDREALMTSIHLSRYPGEKKFGTYQNQGPRQTSVGGTITSGVTNRAEWLDKLLKKHRTYEASASDGLSEAISDYSSKALVVSIHADNLAYVSGSKKYPYNAIDRSKIYVPQAANLNSNEEIILFSEEIEDALSRNGLNFLTPRANDSQTILSLKEGAESSFDKENIKIDHHSTNLVMLSSKYGNSNTMKVLIEGFAMTGKMGELISRELDQNDHKKITFSRLGTSIGDWTVSDYYIEYARSVAQSIDQYLNCD